MAQGPQAQPSRAGQALQGRTTSRTMPSQRRTWSEGRSVTLFPESLAIPSPAAQQQRRHSAHQPDCNRPPRNTWRPPPMLRAAVQPAWHEAPWAMLKPQCLAQTGGTNQYFQPLPPLPRLPNSAWPPGPHTSAGPLPAVSSASLLRDMNLREQCDKVRGSGVSRPDLVLGQPTCSSAREGAAKATCSVSHSRTRTRTLDF